MSFRTSSPSGKSIHGEGDSPVGVAASGDEASRGWIDRVLPPRGFERSAFLLLAALVLGLRVFAIYHCRLDSDESQHAHVVWGWVTGRLQYRDLFDNHMPLFQILYAPVMALLGERADIQVALRWTVLPLYFGCLWCVFNLTEKLFSKRAAPWVCLGAAAMPQFFLTSTEFRTDDLWALFWLLGLLVAVTGKFTVRRAFVFGLILGLTVAVSLKTMVLVTALLIATVFAIVLACLRRTPPSPAGTVARAAAIAVGSAIPPALTVLYFAQKGAFWIMYYCVLSHNSVLGLKGWNPLSPIQWTFPVSLLLMGLCAWLISRQTADTGLAMKRTIILLTPWFFLSLLLSYWPNITREDDLPYVPLTLLLAIPLLIWLKSHLISPRLEASFFTWILPALCLVPLICIAVTFATRKGLVPRTTRRIHDILLLTGPNDFVMDPKGDSIFRMRPIYWVFETVTYHRIRFGLLKVNVPEALENKETKVCYINSARFLPAATRFIVSNYLLFDHPADPLAVAGKELESPSGDGNYSFDVAIPATYAVVSESGTTSGQLDGAPYTGPVRLEAGHHQFHRISGSGRAAIFLGRALAEGFHPLFDETEQLAQKIQSGKQLEGE